ncbi:MAG: aromatic ring-hydroxylating dioxygenase subunit alpha, partial [Verrucomicrobiota bacterium]
MPIISETQVRTACAQQQAAHLELLPSLKASRVRMSVEEILAEIQQAADQPLDQAYTIPSEAYTSDAFYAWEMEEIFRKEWYCLLHVSQIPQVGDFVNLDLFGNPLVVVRDKSEDIQVLSRTCPHRAMDIMPPGFGYDGHGPAEPKEGKPGCGHTRLFICPYHSWTFDLDGKLKGCPEMQEAAGFRRDDWALTSFRSEVWNGFVFVNLDGKAPRSAAEQYRELGDDLGRWNSAEMELVMERDWEIPCNWKVLTENFMESYHHLGAHAKTLQPTMHAKDTWTEEEKAHYIRCHLPYKAATRAK